MFNNFHFYNKKSKLFGISYNNFIYSKYSIAMIEGVFINDRGKYFKVEMINLLLDTKFYDYYETISQAIVARFLKNLEKLGYIQNLQVTEFYMSDEELILEHLYANMSIGNYKNLLKINKKYKMRFVRTDKEISEEFIKEFLKDDFMIDYNLDSSIDKVKYKNGFSKKNKK